MNVYLSDNWLLSDTVACHMDILAQFEHPNSSMAEDNNPQWRFYLNRAVRVMASFSLVGLHNWPNEAGGGQLSCSTAQREGDPDNSALHIWTQWNFPRPSNNGRRAGTVSATHVAVSISWYEWSILISEHFLYPYTLLVKFFILHWISGPSRLHEFEWKQSENFGSALRNIWQNLEHHG